jgi:hypothetical protein
MITVSPPSRWAGVAMMTGTHRARNLSAWARPPGAKSAQGASWPSLHRFGARRKENAVVTLARVRSLGAYPWFA